MRTVRIVATLSMGLLLLAPVALGGCGGGGGGSSIPTSELNFPTIVATLTLNPTAESGGPNVEKEHEYVMCGDNCYFIGADGHRLELFNNPQAHNPAWQELKEFLASDDTDEIEYNSSSFTCGDFAERLHNNAEEAGLRAAFVSINFSGTGNSHALNAFNTTDIGLMYIDCTGVNMEHYPCSKDTRVDVEIGAKYIPKAIFSCTTRFNFKSMGTVTDIDIQW